MHPQVHHEIMGFVGVVRRAALEKFMSSLRGVDYNDKRSSKKTETNQLAYGCGSCRLVTDIARIADIAYC